MGSRSQTSNYCIQNWSCRKTGGENSRLRNIMNAKKGRHRRTSQGRMAKSLGRATYGFIADVRFASGVPGISFTMRACFLLTGHGGYLMRRNVIPDSSCVCGEPVETAMLRDLYIYIYLTRTPEIGPSLGRILSCGARKPKQT